MKQGEIIRQNLKYTELGSGEQDGTSWSQESGYRGKLYVKT